jgi:hypothetical protein
VVVNLIGWISLTPLLRRWLNSGLTVLVLSDGEI